MLYINGRTGEYMDVARLDDLTKIAKRVKRDEEYGAVFKINPLDCVYVTYSTDLNTKSGTQGGFCLLWSDGRAYKAVKPYAYENARAALNALYRC